MTVPPELQAESLALAAKLYELGSSEETTAEKLVPLTQHCSTLLGAFRDLLFTSKD